MNLLSQTVLCLGSWRNTWVISDSAVMRKWNLLCKNVYEYENPIHPAMELLSFCPLWCKCMNILGNCAERFLWNKREIFNSDFLLNLYDLRTGVQILAEKRETLFFSKTSSSTLRPIQLPLQWHRGSCSGVNRLGREFDHLPPMSAEVKNGWSYKSTPTVCLCRVGRDKLLFCNFSGTLLLKSLRKTEDA